MDYVIGCDIGSQGVKTVLLSVDGAVAGEASSSYGIDYPAPTWAEQPVERWLTALVQAASGLLAATGVSAAQVRAISLAAQVDGVVPVGADGAVLGPAIIWMDRRAVAECDAIGATAGALEIAGITGLNLDASHVAPKIRWLAENRPEIYARAAFFLLPGSFVAYTLTGALGVDYSNASSSLLMDVRRRAWSPEMCAAWQVDPDRLAPILPATAPLGRLRPEWAARMGLSPDTWVILGSGDEHAACLGAGVTSPGLVGDISGTAEPVCAASEAPVFDPSGLVETHCHADPALWLLENPGFVSGANYRWFKEQFAPLEMRRAARTGGNPYEALDRCAERVSPGAEGLLLLPCLMGAMAPTWEAAARGTFFGFTLAHTRDHFIRAVLEASAYAVRDNTDQMQRLGLPLREIRVVGGGARSRLWRQIKADVTGLPIALPQTVETTALGAGMLALVGCGACASLSEAAGMAVKIVETIDPRPEVSARYEAFYQIYRDTYFALLPVFKKAAQIQPESKAHD
jgi:xylulokinase